MSGIRVERAIQAQIEGIDIAVARGDVREEARRRLALYGLRAKKARAERGAEAFSELLARMHKEATRKGSKGWLVSYAADPRNGIGDHHMRAAEILRDHIEALSGGSGDVCERVDGGRVHNGQMEALLDRRRPGRATLDAAREAVTEQELMPAALAIVIWDRSMPWALAYAGLSKGPKQYRRVMVAIVEALDAAAAHAGVAK